MSGISRSILLFLLVARAGAALEEPTALSNRLERLSRWLRSPRESIRLEAVHELRDLPADSANPLLFSALVDSGAVVRAAAASSLTRMKNDQPTVDQLRPLLRDPDEQVRAAAVWALSQTGGKMVLPDLLPLCRRDGSSLVRATAVRGVGATGDASALPVIIETLRDYSPAIRDQAAVSALERLADDSVGARLVLVARHEYPPTRRIVMYLLSRYGDAQTALPALRAGLLDSDPVVRGEAVLALGRRRSAATLPVLLPLGADPDEHVRGAVAHAIGLIGDDGGVPLLRQLAKDPVGFVRAVAAESLSRWKDENTASPNGFQAAEMFTFPNHALPR